MRGLLRLLPVWIVLLCLSSTPVKAADQAKEELPQGYEDAAEANKVAPAAVRPMALGGGVGAIGEDQQDDDPEKVDPQVIQLEKQHRSQFQQLLDTELAIIRRACDPDPTQPEAIVKAGEQCMSSVLRQCAIAQHKMHQPRAGPPRSMPDARKLLREQFAKVVGKSLRPDQIELYRRESELRAASRKRAVVRYMVVRADQTLVLSTKQREKLVQALIEDYSDNWERSLPIWMQNAQFAPSIPDSQIVPLLNAIQKAVWQMLPKQLHSTHISWIMASGMPVIKD